MGRMGLEGGKAEAWNGGEVNGVGAGVGGRGGGGRRFY